VPDASTVTLIHLAYGFVACGTWIGNHNLGFVGIPIIYAIFVGHIYLVDSFSRENWAWNIDITSTTDLI
jgi:hypothetical protein